MKLFINDNQISDNVFSFREEVSTNNSTQKTELNLSIEFNASTAFNSSQESSDILLTFLPYFQKDSIQSIYVQNNEQQNVIFSTKYKKVSRIMISGYIDPNINEEQISFSLDFEQE